MNTLKHLALLSGLILTAACGAESGDGLGSDPAVDGCTGAKCDTPTGEKDQQCLDRQSEVLKSSNAAFTRDAIRWACADVEGVNAVNHDDRGQEYCEYFALFQPPPESGDAGDERPDAVDLGRPLDSRGDISNLTICVDDDGDGKDDDGRGDKECRTLLNTDQFGYLEDNPTEIVGQCVFTSWHADVEQPVPACRAEDGSEDCPKEAAVLGFPFTADNFRMKISFNSNRAAADLVERCYAPSPNDQVPEDWSDASDPMTEPFYRGCMEVQAHFGTGWRRSDPSVCAVSNRLRECGCLAPGVTNAHELGDALIPPQDGLKEVTLRGFPLGTWTGKSELPPGCHYAKTGEDLQSLVLCDLTANDVMNSLNDPKEACRATYGGQVVVHVPIPADAITCTPGDGPEAKGCGDQPWVIGNENGDQADPNAGDAGSGDGTRGG